ncbi:SulP family inorganic anion transporter [Aridibaculum aurantiacum]|uniref:SulP family inorganic anion transporter n=1 Tax=Aridibaculum aurantiacum TaxID=2810307 RepID=UPI001A97C3A4|nr:SulP family inorganic anion transporter [Aridibaculum aurantiacum]
MNTNDSMSPHSYKKGFFSHAKSDISAGVVVFLIALPLCLGISLASGAPLFAGIIAGIIGGIVVGSLSGANINVSGPAASVALVFLTAITTLGSYEAVLTAAVIAGIFQIILGYLRAGTIAYFFPSSMIKGILASIGLILIINQLPHAFGYTGERLFGSMEGGLYENIVSAVSNITNYISIGATIITVISLIIIFIWDQPSLKKHAFFKLVPAALVAVTVSIFINQFFKSSYPELALAGNSLVQLPVAGSVDEFFSFFTFPDFSVLSNLQVYQVALSITFIASLESLLSTEAGDKLDPYKRKTSTNRELKAQGIGNIISSMIGGLPVTAVIVRTSANVTAGGRTKLSTIMHGLIMLVCVISIPRVLNMIPLPALSAVLFVVGYRLTSVKLFKEMYRLGKRHFIPFVATIIAVMLTNLITGIMIGGAVAIFLILRDNYKTPFFLDRKDHHEGEKINLVLSEEVTFLNKASIMLTLDHVSPNSEVIIDASRCVNIDDDVLEIIQEFRSTAQYKNITITTIDLDKHLQKRKMKLAV